MANSADLARELARLRNMAWSLRNRAFVARNAGLFGSGRRRQAEQIFFEAHTLWRELDDLVTSIESARHHRT